MKLSVRAVLKIGGSLCSSKILEKLCQKISTLAPIHQLLIIPGGGPFADVVRENYLKFSLAEEVAHWMAILGMDQYGYLLHDLTPGSVPVRSLREAAEALVAGKLPILLPFQLLSLLNPLEHSWRVTSDSLALYLATQVEAEMFVLLKDVDGVYTSDPKKEKGAKFLDRVEGEKLSSYACLDEYFATLWQERIKKGKKIACWLISGLHPQRIEELLLRGSTLGTEIL
ncbi:amino acid kinase family protein [Candidatus Hakubella thermalkaliphila]|uniref:5-(Aminomethyl)-3-furanmethanol phosphate kinase n=2 Tax=Candidatus Hakubella thermalkaliphila TaxID=2754717 RepID=A0A6V8PDM2_9ACTN|nr:hypothetical protein [Candidatus Hakubella thermalkaliphila]GFP30443.1 5-(aminomethyl)-3-furanmethanol phosphate kinase [Candidatus Hakubella thermalkaliphila]GFP39443.1 5-(aminomethyl)-3-furanmethanol phosphate kinase [Candidatus Hakubella thermalkaliphila]GFP43069.1 5-(aminomethyl)-3-furanmethanol phosphate kinase [Candidatus Hakubella thermalkaliphila]